ncbi:hypothetical protein L6452_42473 [Arctium lappa]|uniref:Uncharacterized protein n=1 Tax=Arctium lappa TaxID=4217 RepID=A0ACB8XJH5_ARCLA|nr:hypothetical protein L6452_42473 [Arctium lappa]
MMEPTTGGRRVTKETPIQIGNRQETEDGNHCLNLSWNIGAIKETPISSLNALQFFLNVEDTGLEITEEWKRRRGNLQSMGRKITIACRNTNDTRCNDMYTGIEACESSKATETTN